MYLQPTKRRQFKAFVSFTVILCLVINDFVYAAPALPFDPKAAAEKSVRKISVPKAWGKVDEVSGGTSGKTVIYIQDAHDSLEAQTHIARLVRHFTEKEKVRTVFEEGFEGPVPSDAFFGFIKDPKIKEKVSYFLLDKLRIGGAEYAHINRKQDFKLIGADSIKLHLKNIRKYRDFSRLQKKTAEDLAALSAEIEILANRAFPAEFKSWLKFRDRYEAGQLDVLEYLKRSDALLKSSKIPAGFKKGFRPLIQMLFAAETSLDPKALAALKKLDARALFLEIDEMEEELAQLWLVKPVEREIFHIQKQIRLLQRLGSFQITAEEYDIVKGLLKSIRTQELAEFVARHANKPVLLSRRWERAVRHAMEFYEIAHQRDETMKKTLKNFLKNPEEKTAVLVFGGFHRRAIREYLKANHFSFLVVTPRMSGADPERQATYQKLMSGQRHAFEASIPAAVKTAARAKAIFEMGLKKSTPVLRRLAGVVEISRELSDSLLVREVTRHFESGGKIVKKSRRVEEVSKGGSRLELRSKASLSTWFGYSSGVDFDPEENHFVEQGPPYSPRPLFSRFEESRIRRIDEIFEAISIEPAPSDKNPGGYFQAAPLWRLIRALKAAGIRRSQLIADLGHGDGHTLLTLSSIFGTRGTGREWNSRLHRKSEAGKKSLERQLLLRPRQVQLEEGDFNELDISQADYVFYYSNGADGKKINLEKIMAKMKTGAKLILLGVQVDNDLGRGRTNYYQDFSPLLESGLFDLHRKPEIGAWIFTKKRDLESIRHEIRTSPALPAPLRWVAEEELTLTEALQTELQGKMLRWKDRKQQMHEATVGIEDQVVNSYEGSADYEKIMTVFPSQREIKNYPQLRFFPSTISRIAGLPKKNSFGNFILREFMWQGERVLVVRQIQSSPSFHSLGTHKIIRKILLALRSGLKFYESKEDFGRWKDAFLTALEEAARKAGYKHIFVHSHREIRKQNPRTEGGGIGVLTHESLYEHYIRLFRGRWEHLQVPDSHGMGELKWYWHKELRQELRSAASATPVLVWNIHPDTQRDPLLAQNLSGKNIFWTDAQGGRHSAKLHFAVRALKLDEDDYENEFRLHIFPDEKELAAYPDLKSLQIKGRYSGLPETGSFGNLVLRRATFGKTPALWIRQVQSSPGFHSLSEQQKKIFGRWKDAAIQSVIEAAKPSGYDYLVATSHHLTREIYPSTEGGKQGGMTPESLYEHYIRPYRGKWDEIQTPLGFPGNFYLFWHKDLNRGESFDKNSSELPPESGRRAELRAGTPEPVEGSEENPEWLAGRIQKEMQALSGPLGEALQRIPWEKPEEMEPREKETVSDDDPYGLFEGSPWSDTSEEIPVFRPTAPNEAQRGLISFEVVESLRKKYEFILSLYSDFVQTAGANDSRVESYGYMLSRVRHQIKRLARYEAGRPELRTKAENFGDLARARERVQDFRQRLQKTSGPKALDALTKRVTDFQNKFNAHWKTKRDERVVGILEALSQLLQEIKKASALPAVKPSMDRPAVITYQEDVLEMLERANPGIKVRIEKNLTTSFSKLRQGVDYDKRSGGRSVLLRLKNPVFFKGRKIQILKIKGTLFDTGLPAESHDPYGVLRTGRVRNVPERNARLARGAFTPQGVFSPEEMESEAFLQGRQKYEYSLREFTMSQTALEEGVEVSVPVGHALFENEKSKKGTPMGAVVLGLPEEEGKDLILVSQALQELSEQYVDELEETISSGSKTRGFLDYEKQVEDLLAGQGKVLHQLHEKGIFHGNFHLSNAALVPDGAGGIRWLVLDMEGARSRKDLTAEQALGHLVWDLRQMFATFQRVLDNDNTLYGKLPIDWMRLFLKGYFSSHPESEVPPVQLGETDDLLAASQQQKLPLYQFDHPLIDLLIEDFRSMLRAELRSGENLKGVDKSRPLYYFLRAFGIDAAQAEIQPLEGDWGRVEIGKHPVLGLEGETLEEAVFESVDEIFSIYGIPEIYRRVLETKDKGILSEIYLLTYKNYPMAFVWPLAGDSWMNELLYYPIYEGYQISFRDSFKGAPWSPGFGFPEIEKFVTEYHTKKFRLNRSLDMFVPYNAVIDFFRGLRSEKIIARIANSGTHSFPGTFIGDHPSTVTLLAALQRAVSLGLINFKNLDVTEIGSGAGPVTAALEKLGADVQAFDLTLLKALNTWFTAVQAGSSSRVKVFRARSVKELPRSRFYVWNVPDLSPDAKRFNRDEPLDFDETVELNTDIHPDDFSQVLREIKEHAPEASILLRISIASDEQEMFKRILKETGWQLDLNNPEIPAGKEPFGKVLLLRPALAALIPLDESQIFAGRHELRTEGLRPVELDLRAYKTGLLNWFYIGHDMSIKKAVNPGNKELTAVYGGAGADVSNFLLSTNATGAYFINGTMLNFEKMQAFLNNGLLWAEHESTLQRYKNYKYQNGFAVSNDVEMYNPEIKILFEMKSIGAENITVRKEGDAVILEFDWQYPGDVKKPYRITYWAADMTKPGDYPQKLKEVLAGGIDIYYQRAGFEIAKNYEKFLPLIARSLRPGGFLLTDDYYYDYEEITDAGHFHRQDPLPFLKESFKVTAVDTVALKVYREEILSRKVSEDIRTRAMEYYGWDVIVRQVAPGRSELRTDLTDGEKQLIRDSRANGFQRAGASPFAEKRLWLFGENDIMGPFLASLLEDTDMPAVPGDLYRNQKVLVVPGYGNLPFLLKMRGAREVMGMDIDPVTIAWQKLKLKHGAETYESILNANETSRWMVRQYYIDRWMHYLDEAPASGNISGLSFQTGNILEPIPYGDQKYDLIVVPYLFGFIHGLITEADYHAALENMKSVLAPGGSIILMPGHADISAITESDDRVMFENYNRWLNHISAEEWDIHHSPEYSFINITGSPMNAGYTILTSRAELRTVQEQTADTKAAEETGDRKFFDYDAVGKVVFDLFDKDPGRKRMPGYLELESMTGISKNILRDRSTGIRASLKRFAGDAAELQARIDRAILLEDDLETGMVRYLVEHFSAAGNARTKEFPPADEIARGLDLDPKTVLQAMPKVVRLLEINLPSLTDSEPLRKRLKTAIHLYRDLTGYAAGFIIGAFASPNRVAFPSTEELGQALGRSAVNVRQYILPEVLPVVEERINQKGFPPALRTRILISSLTYQDTVLGAAYLIWNRFMQDPSLDKMPSMAEVGSALDLSQTSLGGHWEQVLEVLETALRWQIPDALFEKRMTAAINGWYSKYGGRKQEDKDKGTRQGEFNLEKTVRALEGVLAADRQFVSRSRPGYETVRIGKELIVRARKGESAAIGEAVDLLMNDAEVHLHPYAITALRVFPDPKQVKRVVKAAVASLFETQLSGGWQQLGNYLREKEPAGYAQYRKLTQTKIVTSLMPRYLEYLFMRTDRGDAEAKKHLQVLIRAREKLLEAGDRAATGEQKQPFLVRGQRPEQVLGFVFKNRAPDIKEIASSLEVSDRTVREVLTGAEPRLIGAYELLGRFLLENHPDTVQDMERTFDQVLPRRVMEEIIELLGESPADPESRLNSEREKKALLEALERTAARGQDATPKWKETAAEKIRNPERKILEHEKYGMYGMVDRVVQSKNSLNRISRLLLADPEDASIVLRIRETFLPASEEEALHIGAFVYWQERGRRRQELFNPERHGRRLPFSQDEVEKEISGKIRGIVAYVLDYYGREKTFPQLTEIASFTGRHEATLSHDQPRIREELKRRGFNLNDKDWFVMTRDMEKPPVVSVPEEMRDPAERSGKTVTGYYAAVKKEEQTVFLGTPFTGIQSFKDQIEKGRNIYIERMEFLVTPGGPRLYVEYKNRYGIPGHDLYPLKTRSDGSLEGFKKGAVADLAEVFLRQGLALPVPENESGIMLGSKIFSTESFYRKYGRHPDEVEFFLVPREGRQGHDLEIREAYGTRRVLGKVILDASLHPVAAASTPAGSSDLSDYIYDRRPVREVAVSPGNTFISLGFNGKKTVMNARYRAHEFLNYWNVKPENARGIVYRDEHGNYHLTVRSIEDGEAAEQTLMDLEIDERGDPEGVESVEKRQTLYSLMNLARQTERIAPALFQLTLLKKPNGSQLIASADIYKKLENSQPAMEAYIPVKTIDFKFNGLRLIGWNDYWNDQASKLVREGVLDELSPVMGLKTGEDGRTLDIHIFSEENGVLRARKVDSIELTEDGKVAKVEDQKEISLGELFKRQSSVRQIPIDRYQTFALIDHNYSLRSFLKQSFFRDAEVKPEDVTVLFHKDEINPRLEIFVKGFPVQVINLGPDLKPRVMKDKGYLRTTYSVLGLLLRQKDAAEKGSKRIFKTEMKLKDLKSAHRFTTVEEAVKELAERKKKGLENTVEQLRKGVSEGGDRSLWKFIRRWAVQHPKDIPEEFQDVLEGYVLIRRTQWSYTEALAELERRDFMGFPNDVEALREPKFRGGYPNLLRFIRAWNRENPAARIPIEEPEPSLMSLGSAAIWRSQSSHYQEMENANRELLWIEGKIQKVAESFIPVVTQLARKRARWGYWKGVGYVKDQDDEMNLVQTGNLLVLEALRDWRPTLGMTLTAFVENRVEKNIRNAMYKDQDGYGWIELDAAGNSETEGWRKIQLISGAPGLQADEEGIGPGLFDYLERMAADARLLNREREQRLAAAVSETSTAEEPVSPPAAASVPFETASEPAGEEAEDEDMTESAGVSPSAAAREDQIKILVEKRNRSTGLQFVSQDDKYELARELGLWFQNHGLPQLLEKLGVAHFSLHMVGSLGKLGSAIVDYHDLNLLVASDADEYEMEEIMDWIQAKTGGFYQYEDVIGKRHLAIGKNGDFDHLLENGSRDFASLLRGYGVYSRVRGLASIEAVSFGAVKNSAWEEENERRKKIQANTHRRAAFNLAYLDSRAPEIGVNGILVWENRDGAAGLLAQLANQYADEWEIRDYYKDFIDRTGLKLQALMRETPASLSSEEGMMSLQGYHLVTLKSKYGAQQMDGLGVFLEHFEDAAGHQARFLFIDGEDYLENHDYYVSRLNKVLGTNGNQFEGVVFHNVNGSARSLTASLNGEMKGLPVSYFSPALKSRTPELFPVIVQTEGMQATALLPKKLKPAAGEEEEVWPPKPSKIEVFQMPEPLSPKPGKKKASGMKPDDRAELLRQLLNDEKLSEAAVHFDVLNPKRDRFPKHRELLDRAAKMLGRSKKAPDDEMEGTAKKRSEWRVPPVLYAAAVGAGAWMENKSAGLQTMRQELRSNHRQVRHWRQETIRHRKQVRNLLARQPWKFFVAGSEKNAVEESLETIFHNMAGTLEKVEAKTDAEVWDKWHAYRYFAMLLTVLHRLNENKLVLKKSKGLTRVYERGESKALTGTYKFEWENQFYEVTIYGRHGASAQHSPRFKIQLHPGSSHAELDVLRIDSRPTESGNIVEFDLPEGIRRVTGGLGEIWHQRITALEKPKAFAQFVQALNQRLIFNAARQAQRDKKPLRLKTQHRHEIREINAQDLKRWIQTFEKLAVYKNPKKSLTALVLEIENKLKEDEADYFRDTWRDFSYKMSNKLNRILRRNTVEPADQNWIHAFLALAAAILSSQDTNLEDLRRLDRMIQSWNSRHAPRRWNFSLPVVLLLVNNRAVLGEKLKAQRRLMGRGMKLPGEYRYRMAALNLLLLGMHDQSSLLFSGGFDEISSDYNPKRSLALTLETIQSGRFNDDVPANLYEELMAALKIGLVHFLYGSSNLWPVPSWQSLNDHDREKIVPETFQKVWPLQDFIVANREFLAKTVREIDAFSREQKFSYLGAGIPWLFDHFLDPMNSPAIPPATWDQILLNGFDETFRPWFLRFMRQQYDESDLREDARFAYTERVHQLYEKLARRIETLQPVRQELRKAVKAAPHFQHKRILIDSKDFSDEQIKEIAYIARRPGRNVKILIAGVDPSDAMGKFLESRQSENLIVRPWTVEEMARHYAKDFKGDVIYLAANPETVKAQALKRQLREAAGIDHVYVLAYGDEHGGILGVGLRDLENGNLRYDIKAQRLTKPEYFEDRNGVLYISDPQAAGMSFWQKAYHQAFAFARAA